MIATTLLITAPQDRLLVTDPNGRGYIELAGGMTHCHESPEAAAGRILRDTFDLELPAGRLVGLDRARRASRSVITHIFATGPLSKVQARVVEQRAERGRVRFLPRAEALPLLRARSRARATAGLQALIAGTVAHLGTLPDATAAVSGSAVVIDPQGRLLIMRDGTRGTWSLPGGPLDTRFGEGPRRAAERHALKAAAHPVALDQLLAIDWCHPPQHRAEVHYLYGASTSVVPGYPPSHHGRADVRSVELSEIAAVLSPTDVRRVQACLSARAKGALELHNGHRATHLRSTSSAHACCSPSTHQGQGATE
ncbi:hypothetical protein [Streptomyces lydicus]|uniref:hypothetical protein n=1 Tax=Streptomyces lydicus TaxID=47763 RepID=UPI0013E97AF5|nr:hypothetical protein [Streptomyces lydicus]MCZ1012231.1 hypothetical protein [Streptomyces lydicus]